MPELPEIYLLARQMNQALSGRSFTGVEILQDKCLNVPVQVLTEALTGARITSVDNHGKWIFTQTTRGWLLINLGMGGEVLLTTRPSLPPKHRLVFDLDSGGCLSVNFWWFGYAHYVPKDGLETHEMTRKLGPNALDLDRKAFIHRIRSQRGQVKALLLDQSFLAGIGNSYVHDILFLARLHPQRRAPSLSDSEAGGLYDAVHTILEKSIAKRGAFYEMDLYGDKGEYGLTDILIGYKEEQPCPNCGTAIQKIKTGSTSSFICPSCQLL